MELKSRLTEPELELLKEIGILIENREYDIDETGDIIDKLDDAIQNNLDKDLNFTPKAIEYEKIQDKILEYENN